jgi:MoaA/NifB/PqqE/SkfB family radical SAM enzyme
MPVERIYYEICNVCNFSCKHCFEDKPRSAMIDLYQLLDFHQKISGCVNDFVITGGEPGIHPKVYTLIDAIAACGKRVTLTTNGSELDADTLTLLLKKYPRFNIQFSFDAFTKEIFEKIRGNNTFDKVLNTILALHEFHTQVILSMTLLKYNLDEIDAVLSFANQHKFMVFFPSLIPVGAVLDNWDELIPDTLRYGAAEDKIVAAAAAYDSVSSNKISMIVSNYINREKKYHNHNRTVKIDADGFIIPCAVISRSHMIAKGELPVSIAAIKDYHDFSAVIEHTAGCRQHPNVTDVCAQCDCNMICNRYYCGFCRYFDDISAQRRAFFCDGYRRMYKQIAG